MQLVLIFSTYSIQAAPITVSVVDANGHPLEDIAIYVTYNNVQQAANRQETVEILQKDKAFKPYVNIVQSGQAITFTNQDNITHHIFSSSRENQFAFKLRAGEDSSIKTFSHSGNISMACNIHDWMSGHLLVVDTPFYGKSDQQGQHQFEIDHSGEITINIWHPQMQEQQNNMVKTISFFEPSNPS